MVLGEALSLCRVFFKQMIRTGRTLHKIATAVRTDVVEMCFSAIPAESALKCANYCAGGITREIGVTAFAIGFQFHHGELVPK